MFKFAYIHWIIWWAHTPRASPFVSSSTQSPVCIHIMKMYTYRWMYIIYMYMYVCIYMTYQYTHICMDRFCTCIRICIYICIYMTWKNLLTIEYVYILCTCIRIYIMYMYTYIYYISVYVYIFCTYIRIYILYMYTYIYHVHVYEHFLDGHFIYECIVSGMNESCHLWMSHVPEICTWYRWTTRSRGVLWVMSLMNESCPSDMYVYIWYRWTIRSRGVLWVS